MPFLKLIRRNLNQYNMCKITLENIKEIYNEFKEKYGENYTKNGVEIPKLYSGGKVTGLAFALMTLYKNMDKEFHQSHLNRMLEELTNTTNRDCQVRHLSTQKGFDVESPRRGWHKLKSLDIYKNFVPQRRDVEVTDEEWEELKKQFDYRCATCSSKEHMYPFKRKASNPVKLTKGHCDPRKPLTTANCIPHCNYCNGIYQGKFIFDKEGNVKKQINFR